MSCWTLYSLSPSGAFSLFEPWSTLRRISNLLWGISLLSWLEYNRLVEYNRPFYQDPSKKLSQRNFHFIYIGCIESFGLHNNLFCWLINCKWYNWWKCITLFLGVCVCTFAVISSLTNNEKAFGKITGFQQQVPIKCHLIYKLLTAVRLD